MLTFLTLVGMLTAGLAGRTLVRLGERLLSRMPVVRSVYATLKQIFETVLAQSSRSFREVVLIEYPRRGLGAIGFVTGPTRGEIQERSDDELVNVFLPTTPNPTSGFLLFVPRKDLIHLDMSIEEGIKLVISGSIVGPAADAPPGALEPRPLARPPAEPQPPAKAAGGTVAARQPWASPSPDRRPPPGARTAGAGASAPGRAGSRGGDRGAATGGRRPGRAPQPGVDGKIREPQRRQAALARAQHLARAAQPEVLLRDLEAVVGARMTCEPRPGGAPSGWAVQQQAGRRPLAAPDPAAQLVQLGEPEALRLLDHDHGRIGHVDPDLDHRGGHQQLEPPAAKSAMTRSLSRPGIRPWTSPTTSPSAPRAPGNAAPRPPGRHPRRLSIADQRADPIEALAALERGPNPAGRLEPGKRQGAGPDAAPSGGFSRSSETAMSP